MCKVFLTTNDSNWEKTMTDYIHRDMPMLCGSSN